MPVTVVAQDSLEPPPAGARHRDEPPLAAWTPEVRSCGPPKGTTEVRHGGAAISCARPDSPAATAEVCCTKEKKEGLGHRLVTVADRAAHACGAPRPWLLGPAVASAHGTAG